VVDQHILAGNFGLELHDGGAAGRHGYGLHAVNRRIDQRAPLIKVLENLADHVEGRGKIGAADPEEDADRLPHLGVQR
jgi:hypothetical protein